MTTDQWIALVGAILAGFVLRVSNMVIQWLARILGVNPPEPIPTNPDASIDRAGPTPVRSPLSDENRSLGD